MAMPSSFDSRLSLDPQSVPPKTPFAPEELRPQPALTRQAANGVVIVPVPGWEEMPWLHHGFSTRRGGVSRAYAVEGADGELNLGFTAHDERENALRNRALLAEAVTGHAGTPILGLSQIHSAIVEIAGPEAQGKICKGDGLMTAQPGVLLAVQTADCVPVLVADRKRRAVAAFHAGWRGTVKRIVENGVGRMRMEFGCEPEDLVAAIGPAIGACCYSVGEEVISEFDSQFAYAAELFHEVYGGEALETTYPATFLSQSAPGHASSAVRTHVNLIEANRRQLLDAGLKAEAIQAVGGCTSCQQELFFSHRASRGHAGRMMSVIGMKE